MVRRPSRDGDYSGKVLISLSHMKEAAENSMRLRSTHLPDLEQIFPSGLGLFHLQNEGVGPGSCKVPFQVLHSRMINFKATDMI